jgi:lysophospholipase
VKVSNWQKNNDPKPVFDRRSIPAEAVESNWAAADGHAIRRIDWKQDHESCGSILFMAGRGDLYEKYLETLDYWHSQGWQVTASDWRGQAGSGRLGLDDYAGHISDFSVWVSDLTDLWQRWKRENPTPHILIGHSMGGHLVLRALAEQRVDPRAAVLIAPMLGFINHRIPAVIMHAVTWLITRLGDPRRLAWKWSEKPRSLPADRNLLLTSDDARYADELWWREHRPEIAMGPGSWGWTERAYASMRGLDKATALDRVKQPVLLLATSDDKLVDFRAILRAARWLKNSKLVQFGKESRHEILRECDPVRDRALAAIAEFLDETAPATT